LLNYCPKALSPVRQHWPQPRTRFGIFLEWDRIKAAEHRLHVPSHYSDPFGWINIDQLVLYEATIVVSTVAQLNQADFLGPRCDSFNIGANAILFLCKRPDQLIDFFAESQNLGLGDFGIFVQVVPQCCQDHVSSSSDGWLVEVESLVEQRRYVLAVLHLVRALMACVLFADYHQKALTISNLLSHHNASLANEGSFLLGARFRSTLSP
jgi:hypothetical protein